MILFTKKAWIIVLALISYLVAITLCLNKDSSALWFLNILSFKRMMYAILPACMLVQALIHKSVSTSCIIRCKGRKDAMKFQVTQQYFSALIYLCIYFIFIVGVPLLKFGSIKGISLIKLVDCYFRDLFLFILTINVSIIIYKMNLKQISNNAYIVAYVLFVIDNTINAYIYRCIPIKMGLIFSWAFSENKFSCIFLMIFACLSTFIVFNHSAKEDII